MKQEDHAEADREAMRNHFRARVEGTNINSDTLLTTDYLNHFSSIMMLLEIMPTAPEDFVDEVLEWSPVSYKHHFEHSGFRDKDLALSAYEWVPQDIRLAFDTTVDELNKLTAKILDCIKESMESGDLDRISRLALENVPKLNQLIEHAASIVNGEFHLPGEQTGDPESGADVTAEDHQAAVDALFD